MSKRWLFQVFGVAIPAFIVGMIVSGLLSKERNGEESHETVVTEAEGSVPERFTRFLAGAEFRGEVDGFVAFDARLKLLSDVPAIDLSTLNYPDLLVTLRALVEDARSEEARQGPHRPSGEILLKVWAVRDGKLQDSYASLSKSRVIGVSMLESGEVDDRTLSLGTVDAEDIGVEELVDLPVFLAARIDTSVRKEDLVDEPLPSPLSAAEYRSEVLKEIEAEVESHASWEKWYDETAPWREFISEHSDPMIGGQEANGYHYEPLGFAAAHLAPLNPTDKDGIPITQPVVRFAEYLKDNGTELLFVPVPLKSMCEEVLFADLPFDDEREAQWRSGNPQWRKYIYDLNKAGVTTLDLLEEFRNVETCAFFEDHHWNGVGLRIAARKAGALIRGTAQWQLGGPDLGMDSGLVMAKGEKTYNFPQLVETGLFPKDWEKTVPFTTIWQTLPGAGGVRRYAHKHDPSAKVIVTGDSNLGVLRNPEYKYPVYSGIDGGNGSFSAHLAYYSGEQVTVVGGLDVYRSETAEIGRRIAAEKPALVVLVLMIQAPIYYKENWLDLKSNP